MVGWLSGALQVRDRLVAACEARGVQFIYNASVEGFVQLQDQQPQHQHQQHQQQLPLDAPAMGAAAAAQAAAAAAAAGPDGADVTAAADRCASGAEAGTSEPGAVGTEVAAAAAAPKRSKKGKGKGQGAVAAAAGDAQPPPPTKWLCRLRDGTEHITDKLVRAVGSSPQTYGVTLQAATQMTFICDQRIHPYLVLQPPAASSRNHSRLPASTNPSLPFCQMHPLSLVRHCVC